METNKKAVTLAQLIEAHQRSKAEVAALSRRVDGLITAGGEPNVITAIKNNGTALEITDKAVDIAPAIAAAVAAAGHLKRKKVDSVDAIDPTAADADQYIYMVPKTDSGNGDKYDEYMVMDGAVERVGDWAVDLSGYQPREDGKGLSEANFTAAEKEKLAEIEIATDAEVAAALDEIYGAGGDIELIM